MKKFYASMKALVAVVLLLVPGTTFAQELAELVGKYELTLGPTRFVGEQDKETPIEGQQYTVSLTVNEEKQEVYMKGFIGTPKVKQFVDDDLGGFEQIVDSCYVGKYTKTVNPILGTQVKVEFSTPEGSVIILPSYEMISLKEPFELMVKKDKEGVISFSTSEDIFYNFTGDEFEGELAVNTVKMNKKETYTISEEDLVGSYSMTYKTYNDVGNEEVVAEPLTFDIVNKEGKLYLNNISYLTDLGITYDLPIELASDGFEIPFTNAGSFVAYGDQYGMDMAPISFSFGPEGKLILTSFFNLMDMSTGDMLQAFDGVAEKKGGTDPVDPIAIEKFVGRYVVTLGGAKFEDESLEAPGEMKAKILLNEKNELCMVGLIGTPIKMERDPEDPWVTTQVDSCYTGVYDEKTGTVTFTYPEGFDIVDGNYNTWVLAQPFTVTAKLDENGLVQMETTDSIYFDCYGKAAFEGITMKQMKPYSYTKEELVGYYEMPYNTYDEVTFEPVPAEKPATFELVMKNDELVMVNLFDTIATEIPVVVDALGLRIPCFENTQGPGEFLVINADPHGLTKSPVEFYFGENGTLELSTWMLVMQNYGSTTTQIFPEAVAAKANKPAVLTPAPGHYAKMPAVFTLVAPKEVVAVENGMFRTNKSFRGMPITEEMIKISGSEVVITLPAADVENVASLSINFKAKMADGTYATFGSMPETVVAEYTADVVANLYELESVTPAEDVVVSALESFTLVMKSPNSRDMVGGFDAKKVIALTNENGEQVATGTIDFGENWTHEAIVTLDKKITESGTYKLTIPEATIYNSGYDEFAEDFGVGMGAIYNPEIILTFKVVGVTGIENIENETKPASIYNISGFKMNDIKKLPKGVYIINGKKVLVK